MFVVVCLLGWLITWLFVGVCKRLSVDWLCLCVCLCDCVVCMMVCLVV